MTPTMADIDLLATALTPFEQKLDVICDQNIALREMFLEDMASRRAGGGNVQKVIHKSEGPGVALQILLGVAITACVMTWGGLFMLHAELRDAKAWIDLHNSKLAKLEAK